MAAAVVVLPVPGVPVIKMLGAARWDAILAKGRHDVPVRPFGVIKCFGTIPQQRSSAVCVWWCVVCSQMSSLQYITYLVIELPSTVGSAILRLQ